MCKQFAAAQTTPVPPWRNELGQERINDEYSFAALFLEVVVIVGCLLLDEDACFPVVLFCHGLMMMPPVLGRYRIVQFNMSRLVATLRENFETIIKTR